MKIVFYFLFISSLFTYQSCQPDNSNNPSFFNDFSKKKIARPFYLGGIHINEPDIPYWVKTLDEVGMNTVEVTVYAKQWLWNTSDIAIETEAEGMINEIREAKDQGLSVVLVLRTQLQHWFPENYFLWHGMIMPKEKAMLNCWFEKYAEFCNYWAKVSEREGVDVLVIGNELNALFSTNPIVEMPELYQYYNDMSRQFQHENRVFKYQSELEEKHLWVNGKDNYRELENMINEKIRKHHVWGQEVTFGNEEDSLAKMNARRKSIKTHWISIIGDLRKVYNGKLSLAANFDNYQEVDFWEHLDFIGINAYFPLREPVKNFPNSEEMLVIFKDSWQRIFDEIEIFKQEKNIENMPVLFTELGYTRTANSTLESWSGQGFSVVGTGENEQLIIWEEQSIYPFERYLAVKTLLEVSQNHTVKLNGILYWKLSTGLHILSEEPFGLHIHPRKEGGLQEVLVDFLD